MLLHPRRHALASCCRKHQPRRSVDALDLALGISDEIGEAHQLMLDNRQPYGNMAALVNATEAGKGAA